MGRPELQSCLYEGRVRHCRTAPVEHRFAFPLFLVYLDLAELDRVFAGRWLWSTRSRAFARFDRADHLGDARRPLEDCVRDLVEDRTGGRPRGPIRLLTHLRYAGYPFNPVSFHYCFDERDRGLEAVVADVRNTPWGERHAYVLGRDETRGAIRATEKKRLHVSPFMPMDQTYRFTFEVPGPQLVARIESLEPGGQRIFDATVQLARRPLDTGSLARVLARYPFMTAQTIAAIYWQALRLFVKRAPFHPHPETSP